MSRQHGERRVHYGQIGRTAHGHAETHEAAMAAFGLNDK
jgi:hypothetical protein